MAFVVEELDSDAVSSGFPVHKVPGLFEVSQNGDGAVKTRQLVLGDRTKPTVFQGAEVENNRVGETRRKGWGGGGVPRR